MKRSFSFLVVVATTMILGFQVLSLPSLTDDSRRMEIIPNKPEQYTGTVNEANNTGGVEKGSIPEGMKSIPLSWLEGEWELVEYSDRWAKESIMGASFELDADEETFIVSIPDQSIANNFDFGPFKMRFDRSDPALCKPYFVDEVWGVYQYYIVKLEANNNYQAMFDFQTITIGYYIAAYDSATSQLMGYFDRGLWTFTPASFALPFTINLHDITNIGGTSADAEFSISLAEGVTLDQFGVCWNQEGMPGIDDPKTEEGPLSSGGVFVSHMPDLETNTTYYVRAYVIYEEDVYYSSQISLHTHPLEITQPQGTGLPDDPYLVSSLNHLAWMMLNPDQWDKHFTQTTDIDASVTIDWNDGAGWSPVGTINTPFTGSYDGAGFHISNATINRPDLNIIGFFGRINYAIIRNLNLTNISVSGHTDVGTIVGGAGLSSALINCSATGSVSGQQFVGGLTGSFQGSEMINCSFSGKLYGPGRLGGLTGGYANYTIQNSFYNMDVVLFNDEPAITIGALPGHMFSDWLGNDKYLEVNKFLQNDGSGYLINNVSDFKTLLGFGQFEGLHFKLTQDIDLEEFPGLYIPLFTSSLNGNGYAIYNAEIEVPFGVRSLGLIAEAYGAIINNLGLVNVSVRSSSTYTGGLIGFMANTSVNNSYVTGAVSGVNFVGGLTGGCWNASSINNSFTDVGVNASGVIVGGLAGELVYPGVIIRNSYSLGEVSGQDGIGGLVGRTFSTIRIENSYAASKVNAPAGRVSGGLVAGDVESSGGVVINSFWDTEASGQPNSSGGTGKTTSEMNNVATYTDLSTEGLTAPWDFTGNPHDDQGQANIWSIDGEFNNGYPFLSWQRENVFSIVLIADPSGFEEYLTGAGIYEEGEKVAISAGSPEGYQFTGWTEQEEMIGNEPDMEITVTGNRTLVAHYKSDVHTVSLGAYPNVGGGTLGGGSYLTGEQVTVRALPNMNFSFDGWVEENDTLSTETTYSFVIDRDRDLKACFSGQQYQITTETMDQNAGTTGGDGSYYAGDIVEVEAFPEEGYHFVRWMENDNQVSVLSPYLFSATKDRQLKAEFAESWWDSKKEGNRCLITATAEPAQAGVVLGQGYYDLGRLVTLDAAANVGVTFDVWLEDGEVVQDSLGNPAGPVLTFDATENRTFIARFGGDKLSVEVSVEGSGLVSVTGDGTFFPGELATVTAVAEHGQRFIGWRENTNTLSANPDYRFTVNENKSLVAYFEGLPQHALTLRVNPLGAGTITQNGEGSYIRGEEVRLLAEERPGYMFIHWREGAETIAAEKEIVFDIYRDHLITAHFERKQYEVHFGVDGEGSVSAETYGSAMHTGDYVYHATQVNFTAQPDESSLFKSWKVNGEILSDVTHNKLSTNVLASDLHVTAIFGLKTYGIAALAGDNGSIYPEGIIEVTHGHSQAFTVTPADGYRLLHIRINGEAINLDDDQNWNPSERQYTFSNVTADYSIEAGFEADNTSLTALEGSSLKVYPNPAQDILYIDLENNSNKLLNIVLYDIVGQVIKQLAVKESGQLLVSMKLDGLLPGIYLLEISGDVRYPVQKVLITE